MTPKDWKEHEIGDLIELETGVSINAEDKPKHADEYGVLKVSAVSYGKFDPTAYKTINDISLCRVRITPKADSVLISRANTFELVGASVYVDKDYTDLLLPDKLWQSRRLSEQLSIKWLSYALTTDRMRYEIMTRATGTSGSMKNISQESFLSIRIPVPSPSEQRKIAEILSTWDDAIDLTEQLMAAKQRRKQALMQRLLTGQVRFPGFEGEWKMATIGDVTSKVGSGITPKGGSESYLASGIPLIRSQNVLTGKLDLEDVAFISEEQHRKMSATRLKANDVLLNITGASIGRSCVVPADFVEGNVKWSPMSRPKINENKNSGSQAGQPQQSPSRRCVCPP